MFPQIDHILGYKANLKYNKKHNNPLNPNRPQWDKIRNKCQEKLQKSFKPMKIEHHTFGRSVGH
jgi:hypothetical protein